MNIICKSSIKSHKAIERSSIGFRRADFTQLLQLRNDTMHKGKEGGLLGQFMEHGNHREALEKNISDSISLLK